MTDAGFLGPWFNAVRQRGWDFIGRLRGLTQVKLDGSDKWLTVKHFYSKASRRAGTLGEAGCAKTAPYRATVHLADDTAKANRAGTANSHTYNEPWRLVASLTQHDYRARQCVNLYSKRMKIELTFRDLKDDRWSMALVNSRARTGERRQMLLLIATLATFMLWLIGLAAETVRWHRHFQANTVTHKRVHSCVFLGREVYRNPNYHIDDVLIDKACQLMTYLLVDPKKMLKRSGQRMNISGALSALGLLHFAEECIFLSRSLDLLRNLCVNRDFAAFHAFVAEGAVLKLFSTPSDLLRRVPGRPIVSKGAIILRR